MAQTDPRQALYKLHVSLRVPVDADARARGEHSRFHWLAEDATVAENKLSGLVVPALVEGGFVTRVREPEIPCERCQTEGTQKAKKERYTPEGLKAHYADAHPGVTSEEV